jgi:hypothetical protein
MASACAIDDDSKMRLSYTDETVIDSSSRHVYTTVTPTTRRGVSHPTLKVILFIPKVRVRPPCGVLSGIEIASNHSFRVSPRSSRILNT